MSNLKLRRVSESTNVLPMGFAEIKNSVDPKLIKELSSRQLSLIFKSMNKHWHKAMAFKEQEILNEGCIWDTKNEKLIELN